MKKIGVLGCLSAKAGCADGQTIKTQMLFNGLQQQYPEEFELIPVDTAAVKTKPVAFLISLLHCLKSTRVIVVLLSKNGRTVLFPVLYLWARFAGGKVFHYAIGGRLADEAKTKRFYKKYLSGFKENWMESPLMVEWLKEQGISNGVFLPNFKQLSQKMPELEKRDDSILRCCTFSRVSEEKGISDAILAVNQVNKQLNALCVTLTVYGTIQAGYEDAFRQLCEQYSECVQYGGCIPTEKSTQILPAYDLLLFPTRWRGEGIPGTVIDAFASGIPVLASNWTYARDMIQEGENGFIYSLEHPEQLAVLLADCQKNKMKLADMRCYCLASAKPYMAETVLPIIREKLVNA